MVVLIRLAPLRRKRGWMSSHDDDCAATGTCFASSRRWYAPVSRHLAHCPTVAYYCQDRLVPLLSHAHLPHAWERDKSAEVGVTHQPKVCNPSAEGLLGPVSRTCTKCWCSRRESNPE